MRIAIASLLSAVLLSSGCLYTNIHTPRAYRSATPADVRAQASDPTVSGRSCYRTALYLFAWGDAGYSAAIADALSERPDSVLYDVNTDTKINSYLLGLYSRVCTVVSGRAGRP